MTATNKVVLDLSEDDALKDAVAKLSPGDSVTMRVTATLDESTGKQAVFSVTEAEVDEPEEEFMGESPEAEIAEEDAGSVIASGKAK